jgi:hypothetical protein
MVWDASRRGLKQIAEVDVLLMGHLIATFCRSGVFGEINRPIRPPVRGQALPAAATKNTGRVYRAEK